MHTLSYIATGAIALLATVAAVKPSNGSPAGPIIIPGDKMGSGVWLKYNGYTAIVYQDSDTSIQGVYGSGTPVGPSSYSKTPLLSAGVARNDTPLAITSVGNQYMHMFYLSAQECSGGNYLYQLYSVIGQPWQDGDLNALKICVSKYSNFLFAVGTESCTLPAGKTNCPIRVGYMAANTQAFMEAFEVYQNGVTWSTAEY